MKYPSLQTHGGFEILITIRISYRLVELHAFGFILLSPQIKLAHPQVNKNVGPRKKKVRFKFTIRPRN